MVIGDVDEVGPPESTLPELSTASPPCSVATRALFKDLTLFSRRDTASSALKILEIPRSPLQRRLGFIMLLQVVRSQLAVAVVACL
jgi:hypothetical protein